MPSVAQIRDIDRGLKALLERLAKGETEITVGIHSQDGEVEKKGDSEGVRLIDVAAAHEFGLGVPRRSFIADWQDQNVELHNKQIVAMAKAIVRGTVPSAEVAAARLANLWVAEVQKRIVSGISPPLAPETIRRKKSSTPLIDTGQLRSSVAYAVNGKLHPSQSFEQATRNRIKAAKKAKKQADRDKQKARDALKKQAKKAISDAVRGLKQTTKKAQKSIAKKLTRRRKKKPPKKPQ